VGGFDIGLERSGHVCVGQVEIDKHARSVLDHHWPDVPKHDDVTTAIDWADEIGLIGNVDLVCGGFPCQDLSVAGKRAGLGGERSGLFFDALAFAKAVKAKTILLENVPGLLSSNQGRDFGVLLTSLADAGYSNIEWRVLNSQFFGVPQRRRRVFIVASLGTEPFREILAERESSTGDLAQSEQAGENTPSATTAGVGVFGQTGFAKYTEGVTTLTATSYKRPEDNVVVNSYTSSSFAGYEEGVGTLRSNGGDLGGGQRNIVGALQARDYKGVGNQYVQENKLVVQQKP
jgi:DNA (cytosine-5)-methyltransferase 1